MGKGHQAIHNRAIQVNLKIDEKMSISRFKAKLKQLRGNFLNTKLAKKIISNTADNSTIKQEISFTTSRNVQLSGKQSVFSQEGSKMFISFDLVILLPRIYHQKLILKFQDKIPNNNCL